MNTDSSIVQYVIDNSGTTFYHPIYFQFACGYNHIELLSRFLEHSEFKNPLIETIIAVKIGNLEIVQKLMHLLSQSQIKNSIFRSRT